ncbi:hypothetical protein [Paenibacillus terreus]|uniref:hypothetical protein n=1 Tax=Paenibacillus terreus TaxID=1387834 RepID=UPI0035CCF1B9
MDESTKVKYCLVQLGMLYYAGGLARKSPIKDTFSYEFVSDESLAFPFIDESFANIVATKCGATVILRNSTFKQYADLYERHKKYIDSEKEWHKEQERALIEELKQQNNTGN